MILTVIDTFTKLCHLIPCNSNASALEVAQLLWNYVFSKHGSPKQLISDRDTRFNNEVFQGIMQQMTTRHTMSTAFHPQTDGQTERLNRVVEETLRHYVSYRQDDWDLLLPAIEFAINNQWQDSIQTTPFFLNYGYHPTLPVDIRMSNSALADSFLHEKQHIIRAGGKFFAQAINRLNQQHLTGLVAKATEMINAAKQRQKHYADQKRRPLAFEPEQEVFLNTKHLRVSAVPSKKLFPRWLGPFTVDKAIGKVAYRLRLPAHWRIHNVFHVSLLKPYRENGTHHPPPPWALLDTQDPELEVEAILDHEPKSVKPERNLPANVLKDLRFKVRWRHYGSDHDTWEPYSNMKNASEFLSAYGF